MPTIKAIQRTIGCESLAKDRTRPGESDCEEVIEGKVIKGDITETGEMDEVMADILGVPTDKVSNRADTPPSLLASASENTAPANTAAPIRDLLFQHRTFPETKQWTQEFRRKIDRALEKRSVLAAAAIALVALVFGAIVGSPVGVAYHAIRAGIQYVMRAVTAKARSCEVNNLPDEAGS